MNSQENSWTVSRLLTMAREQVYFGEERAVYLLLSLLSTLYVIQAGRDREWVDEQITRELIGRWDWWELLTVLPLYQPHYPTYYLLPELAGWEATIVVSMVSLPVTVYATCRAAQSVHDSFHAGALAGVFVATSPYLGTQATWIRMYAPMTALLSVGLWLGLEERYRSAAIAMLAAAVLHVFGAFGAFWLAIIAFREHAYRTSVTLLSLGSLPAAGLLWLNTRDVGITQQSTGVGHGIAPGPLEIILTPVSSLVGSPHYLFEVVGVAIVSAILVTTLVDVRVWAWVIAPVCAISAASYLVHPVFRLKYFGFLAPAIAILLVSPDRDTRVQVVLVIVVTGLLVISWLQRLMPAIVTRRFMFWF